MIEVADTTLRYDRQRKLPLYAKAGVLEVWIEDLQNDLILVYREPAGTTYSTSLVFHRGDSISPSAFVELTINVDDLLG